MNKEKLSIIELFSGIGAQIKGIRNTELYDCDVINTSEIDKDAMLSYAAVHCGLTQEMIEEYKEYPTKEEMIEILERGNIGYDFKHNKVYNWNKVTDIKIKKYYLAYILSKNLGDISKIKALNYADMWTYSFPCTDISVAGKQAGIEKGKTRSGLLYEVERLLGVAIKENKAPKYLLLENVKNLVSKKFKKKFDEWVNRLDELGYNTYWKVLNGKDCGIPQNRERCFAVSIRKEIDKGQFTFPVPFDNGYRLRDILNKDVGSKYYIENENTKKLIKEIMNNKFENNGRSKDIIKVGNIYNSGGENGNIYLDEGISPTLKAGVGVNGNGIGSSNAPKIIETDNYKIRRLTAVECWLLMGFTAEDVEKAKKIGVADTQLYKQAGNSIITNCISLIMEHLYQSQYDNDFICYDVIKGSKDNLETSSENKPSLLGGLGKKDYGGRYRLGNRVYDSDNIAMCIMSQPVGNSGGNSYLYLIDATYANRKPRVYDKYAPALRAGRQGFKVLKGEK